MKQLVITLDSPDIKAREKEGDKDAIAQVKLFLISIHLLSDSFVIMDIHSLCNQISGKYFFQKL